MSNETGVHKLYRRDNQPFAQIPNEAIRNPEITAGAFRLLAYLMSHQDGYELTYGQIERQTGMGRYAINEGIKNLEKTGWLRTEATKMANGQFGPKAWFVLDPTSVGNSTAGNSTTEKPTDKEDNFNKNTKDKEILVQNKFEREFSEFWQVYPRRSGKQAAKKAFVIACKQVGVDVVLDGARRFAKDPYLPVKQFIPHPATWLNQGRWDDEPLPPRELTPEEKAEKARIKNELDRQRAIEENRRSQEESARRKAELEANPVPVCEHERIVYACRVCAPKALAGRIN
jgi:hypothetical protein